MTFSIIINVNDMITNIKDIKAKVKIPAIVIVVKYDRSPVSLYGEYKNM